MKKEITMLCLCPFWLIFSRAEEKVKKKTKRKEMRKNSSHEFRVSVSIVDCDTKLTPLHGHGKPPPLSKP